MRLPDKKTAYGEVPDHFRLFVAATLMEDKKPMKKLSPILVIALCLILITCTALAAAHSLHIIDWFGVGKVNPEEARTAINTVIEQTGGETSLGTFRVSEAFYDGIFLRFIVEGVFAEKTVLIDEGRMAWSDQVTNIAHLEGKRVGVRALAASPAIDQPMHVYPHFEGGGCLLVGQYYFLEGNQAEELHFDLSIDLLDVDDGSPIDSTVISFAIPRTVEATTTEFSIDAQTDFVAVDRAIIARTPLEIHASVEFRPLLRAFNGFTVVPDDGYILKDGRSYFFGGHFDTPEIRDGKGRVEYVLPIEHAEGTTLTLWVAGTDQAIVIDLHTGEASVKKVITHFEGEDKKVEIVEG